MSKDRRVNRWVPYHARAVPHGSRSNVSDGSKLEASAPPSLAEREWEETRCPVCMEHPHNAVLLICSSRDKGCRPYMCDTSYRHSNCLDQFRKTFPEATVGRQNEESVARMHNHSGTDRGRHGTSMTSSNRSLRGQGVELVCPHCRGQIIGWTVDEAARNFMNSRIRSCSLESCEFTGNYLELRKHARKEHPYVRPFEADPQRQSDWARMERQRDLGDTLSAYQQFDPDSDDLLGDDLGPLDVNLGYLDHGDLNMDNYSAGENLFDLLSGFDVEPEESPDEEYSSLVDLSYELEFSFSFLSDLPVCPWEESSSPGSRRTASNFFDPRPPRRQRTRSVDRRETSPRRNASRRESRHRPYFSRRDSLDR